jgi:hypothetical protein
MDIYVNDPLLLKIAASSISSIISLGYPPIMAKIMREMFGDNAFLVSKWLKEYRGNDSSFISNIGNKKGYYFKSNIEIYLEMYEAASKDTEAYKKFQIDNELAVEEDFEIDLNQKKSGAVQGIKDEIKGDIFFYNTLSNGILNNEITNLNEYKKLSFKEALDKYNKKRIFNEYSMIKKYDDGYRWINVGRKCELVGELMNNCGSAGVMSSDPDKTILALFDENNNPHILVTYSPNENRISGFEGKASSEPKDQYLDYIIDLENVLSAKIDPQSGGGNSKLLKLKVLLQGFAKEIERIPYESTFSEFFKIIDFNGKTYISNYYMTIPKENFDFEIKNIMMEGDNNYDMNDYLRIIFNNRYDFAPENESKIIYEHNLLRRRSVGDMNNNL